MSTFSDQIPRRNESFKFLPLFHTCDGYFARKHMRANELVTDDVCEVFHEQVTYLFYGRPAYKYETPDQSANWMSVYPVCFVFDLEMIKDIRRIFPFDSGAMYHKRLSSFMHDKMALTDFEIEPETRRIADVILTFFDTNADYLKAKRNNLELDPLDFESEAFLEMANSKTSSSADERRITIEVQAGKTVPFAGGLLKGMIVPTQYMDSRQFKAFVARTGVAVKCYDVDVWDPKYSFGLVADAASKYLKEEGYDI